MYETFFGLQELPFTLTPNTHFFLKSDTHQQGLEMLLWALKNKEGFLKISGEVGTGKTLLCRKLLNSLGDEYITAYVPNPHCSAETLYCLILAELSANQKSDSLIQNEDSLKSHNGEVHVIALQKIQTLLLNFAQQKKQVVLVIDEAQSMPEDTIEALRLLTNLETESEKLLQVVLFGQPELDQMLSQKNLRQLQQRISFQHKIKPLDRESIEQYISHRMILAGYRGGRLFDAKSIALLAQASKGIPRVVNILCHKALMLAFGEGKKQVNKKHMTAAIKDTASAALPWWKRPGWKKLSRQASFVLMLSTIIFLENGLNIFQLRNIA